MIRVTAVLLLAFILSPRVTAQEVQTVDLRGIKQNGTAIPVTLGRYMICDTDKARTSAKAVRVSVESLAPRVIHPSQRISVVLKVENVGQLAVVLPVAARVLSFQSQANFSSYEALLPLMTGTPGGAIQMGWLTLYGSEEDANTTVNLNPGEWISVVGDILATRWIALSAKANAHSDLQLYQWWPDQSERPIGECVKQQIGASTPVRFAP